MFSIEELSVKADMEVDEERKRFVTAIGLLLSIPTFFVFAFQDLMDSSRLEGIFVMSIVPVFIINLIALIVPNAYENYILILV